MVQFRFGNLVVGTVRVSSTILNDSGTSPYDTLSCDSCWLNNRVQFLSTLHSRRTLLQACSQFHSGSVRHVSHLINSVAWSVEIINCSLISLHYFCLSWSIIFISIFMIFYHHNVQHDISGILTNIFLSSQLLEMSFIEKWKLVAKIWLDILFKYNVQVLLSV